MANTNEIAIQMEKILDGASKEVRRAMSNAQDKVAKEAVQQLKDTSPRKRPEFYKGWAIKRERTGDGVPDVIVYNKTHPGLTHLLENGHVVINGKGRVGSASGIGFMKRVETWANAELPEEFERQLKL